MAWYDSLFPKLSALPVTLAKPGMVPIEFKSARQARTVISVVPGSAKIIVEACASPVNPLFPWLPPAWVAFGTYQAANATIDTSLIAGSLVRVRILADGAGYKVTLTQF